MLHLLITLFVLSSPADTSILFDFQTGCDMNAWYMSTTVSWEASVKVRWN